MYALADAILWCYQHPEEVREMGKAARAKIESRFTLEHYNQRVIALYRSLVQTYRMPFDGDVAAAEVGR